MRDAIASATARIALNMMYEKIQKHQKFVKIYWNFSGEFSELEFDILKQTFSVNLVVLVYLHHYLAYFVLHDTVVCRCEY